MFISIFHLKLKQRAATKNVIEPCSFAFCLGQQATAVYLGTYIELDAGNNPEYTYTDIILKNTKILLRTFESEIMKMLRTNNGFLPTEYV